MTLSKTLLICWVFIQLLNVGCSDIYVSGQSNQKTRNTRNADFQSNTPVENNVDNSAKSAADASDKLRLQDIIVLKEKLEKQDISEENALKIARILGWDDSKEFCGYVAAVPPFYKEIGKKIEIKFFSLDRDKYIVNLSCEGDVDNMFFLYSEQSIAPTIQKMVFEYFEKDIITDKYTRHTTYFPNGGSEFNRKTKELKILAKFTSSANCGYISTYQFKDEKTVLKEVRANWDCDNNYPPNKQWKKENIQKMRNSTSETIDEVKQFKELIQM